MIHDTGCQCESCQRFIKNVSQQLGGRRFADA